MFGRFLHNKSNISRGLVMAWNYAEFDWSEKKIQQMEKLKDVGAVLLIYRYGNEERSSFAFF